MKFFNDIKSLCAKIRIENIYFSCLVLLSFSIPLTIKINSIAMIITFIVALLAFFLSEDKRMRSRKAFLLFIGLYFLHFIGFLNSSDYKPVYTDLEKQLPFLVLPLIFILGPVQSQKRIVLILTGFIVATLLSCLLSFRNGFYTGYGTEDLYNNLLFIRHPYLGMFCIGCIFFCLECISASFGRLTKWIYGFCCVFFVAYLFILFAKMALGTFFILSFFYIGWKLIAAKKYKVVIGVLLLFFLLLFYAALINKKGIEISKKLYAFSDFDWEHYDPAIVNSLNLRFIKWTCSGDVLSQNDNWLLGAGTGDTINLLTECYANKLGENSFFVQDAFNSHNEYLTFWLNLGLFPLLYLLVHFANSLYIYLKDRDLIPILFTLCVIFCGITESVFEVQKGIVFYSFFQSLFLFRQSI